LALRRSQLRWAAGWTASRQTVVAFEHKGVQPVVDRLLADAQALGNAGDGTLVRQQQQGAQSFDQGPLAAAKGGVQPSGQFLDGGVRKGYGDVHGIPPGSYGHPIRGFQDTVSRASCHMLSISFSEDL